MSTLTVAIVKKITLLMGFLVLLSSAVCAENPTLTLAAHVSKYQCEAGQVYRLTSQGQKKVNSKKLIKKTRAKLTKLKAKKTSLNSAATLGAISKATNRKRKNLKAVLALLRSCRKDKSSTPTPTPTPIPPGSAPGLFINIDQLARAKERISSEMEPFYTNYLVQAGRAKNALALEPQPYHTDNIEQMTFGWCDDEPALNTLAYATKHFERQSDHIQTLALQFALSGSSEHGDAARDQMVAWAKEHTVVNLYDFAIDFQQATLTNSTSGMCSDRPWNFALDAMWQTYGLINISDAFLLLTRNGYTFSAADTASIQGWILRVAEGVNSSFHAWTRWADAHPTSSSFERYRSDNHLSWCLAGLLSAAAALGDEDLAAYVLDGGTWTDSSAGAYTNPSHIKDVIDRAIESGTGAANEGRMYEEKILRNPPIGYAIFHLWPMALVAQIAQTHFNQNIWEYTGQDGAGMRTAFKRYADFVLGERLSPRPEQEGDLSKQWWLWELGYTAWQDQVSKTVLESSVRNTYIIQ
ncbi:alginate lyase family protein, partial [Oligoflexia bacterium]|nr:alginate lyase family protein [Oligoflexia bacterium]